MSKAKAKPDWVFVLMLLTLLAISIPALPFAIAAGQNKGTPGTFTAVEKDLICARNTGCEWTGTWVSDDGTIRQDHARYGGAEIKHKGDQVRLQKGVRGDESLYRPDSKFWILLLVADLGAMIYLVLFVRRRLRERRERKQTTTYLPGGDWPDPA